MPKLIVIVGITGVQGGSVASLFASSPEWTVRGITRNTSSPSAQSWLSKGVSLVTADLNEPSSLIAAFEGAYAIFSTTNFYEPFFNPGTQSLLKTGQSINQYCYEQELRQGKNIVDVAAKTKGLERFVVSALCDATKWSGGKYVGVYHFDSKAHTVNYVKNVYPELAAMMSVVQLGSYLSNWQGSLGMRKAEDGSIVLSVLKGTGTKPRPQINVPKDLGCIVRAALQAPPGKNILGASFCMSWAAQFKSWCEMNGLRYGGLYEITLEQFEKFIPVPGLGREIGEMMLFEGEFGYDGGDASVILPGDLSVDCPLTSWEEYVREENWSKVLGKLRWKLA
ncbi:NmrA-like family domain-containing protein [Lachnellula suecica]|uniref:NmrA-like family domain-containing protein n=1 Tax=Lachnellula suecica TaxID=602035 RepID=A0A8T9CI09_9HELO|nr:NmrA-like family domain-containing protein [Lachnellula suecica]